MTRHSLLHIFVTLLWILTASSVTVTANEIAVLTDANFEHDTQATTGSTTGRWLVIFHDGDDLRLRRMLTTPEEEGSDNTMVNSLLEEGVVVGFMNAKTNPETIQRLKIPGAPHAVVLSKGKYYRTNNLQRSDLLDFALSEYEIVTPEEIPPIPSPWEAMLSHPNGKMGIMGVLGSLVLLVIVLLIRPAPKPNKPLPAQKKD